MTSINFYTIFAYKLDILCFFLKTNSNIGSLQVTGCLTLQHTLMSCCPPETAFYCTQSSVNKGRSLKLANRVSRINSSAPAAGLQTVELRLSLRLVLEETRVWFSPLQWLLHAGHLMCDELGHTHTHIQLVSLEQSLGFFFFFEHLVESSGSIHTGMQRVALFNVSGFKGCKWKNICCVRRFSWKGSCFMVHITGFVGGNTHIRQLFITVLLYSDYLFSYL